MTKQQIEILKKIFKNNKRIPLYNDNQEEMLKKNIVNITIDQLVSVLDQYSKGEFSDNYLQRLEELDNNGQ